jgi:hypothetical protein
MARRTKTERVDYRDRVHDRKRMGNYLRVKSFKKIAGTPIFGKKVARRRLWLGILALAILLIGTTYALFL